MRMLRWDETNKRYALAACAILAACAVSACGGGANTQEAEPTTAGASQAPESSQAASESISDSAKAMAELSKAGTMKDGTYTSANGKLQITLPDDSWTATSDLDSFVSFLSGNDTITISCFSGDMAAPLLESIPKTQEEYEAALGNEMQLSQVTSFEYQEPSEDAPQSTKVVRLIRDPSTAVQSQIDYTCYMDGAVYVVSAFLESADEAAMEKVAQAVYSFQATGQ